MRHAANVTVPDDGTSPVGSDEWNARHVPDTRSVGFFTDFFSALGETQFSAHTNGTGAAAGLSTSTGTLGGIGCVDLSTGTTTTGRGGMIWPTANPAANFLHYFGGGAWEWEARVSLPILSDGTDTFLARIGFTTDPSSATVANGCYFEYAPATRGNGNWWLVTRNNNTENAQDTGVAATTAFQVLRLDVNAAATLIEARINGVLVASDSTNVPVSGTSRRFGHGATIIKSLGTNSRTFRIDYWQQWWTPASGRPAS